MILAIVMVVGFFSIMITLIVLDKYGEAILTMIGALTGSVVTIINYEWGSSKGSSDKNEIIKNQQNGKAN